MKPLEDVAPAVGLAVLGLATAHPVDAISGTDAAVDPLALGLIAAAAALLVLRRRYPLPVLAGVTAACSAYLVIGYPYGPVLLCFALAVYTVARHLALRPAAWSCAVAVGVLLLHLLTPDSPGWFGLIPGTAWAVVPFSIGAARRAVATAGERERAEQERRLVDGERLRLAQEVHDVVGHGLAAIQMQADIALHVADADQARVALRSISAASADALSDLRTTLAAVAPDPEGRAPTPGLARLEDLTDRVRACGVEVGTVVRGRSRSLPAHVDLVAYRVLQESLTNVVKHSSHPRARIEIAYAPGQITLLVANQLVLEEPVEGFGITGMRRRVEQAGGQFAAGPVDGEFRIRAVLPVEETS